MYTKIYFYHISLISSESEIFQTNVVQTFAIQNDISINCLWISCRLRRKMEEFCTTIEVPYGYIAHAHCMLDNQGYKDNIWICNIYCFSTEKNVCRNTHEHKHILRKYGGSKKFKNKERNVVTRIKVMTIVCSYVLWEWEAVLIMQPQ